MYCILQGNASVSLIDFLYPVYLIHTKEKHSPWDFFQNCISLFILVCENCEIWTKNRRWYCFCSRFDSCSRRFDMPYQNHITCTWIEYQMFFSKQQVLRSRYTQNVHTLRGMYAQKRKIAQNQKDVLQASCQKNRENFKVMKFLHTMLIQFHTHSRLLYEICGRFRGVIFPFSNSLGLFWWKYLIFLIP